MASRKQKPQSNGSVAKMSSIKKYSLDEPFQHAHLSDDELFQLPLEHLRGDVILRLAHRYSNQAIFERANAANPGTFQKVTAVSNCLMSAVRAAATASGCSVKDVRASIAEARSRTSNANEETAAIAPISQCEDARIAFDAPVVRFPQDLAPSLQTHILFIFVGSERTLTTIHTALLPTSTRAVLEEKARQNMIQERPIYLIDDLPENFEIYRLFLYTGKIFSNNTQTDQDHADNGLNEVHGDREWMRLAHVYLMGLSLDDEKFRNAVIDALVEKVTETDRYPTGIASEVYTSTVSGDKLRSLIVDLHVWKGQGTGVRPPHDDASGPMEFVQDVLRGLAEARSDAYDPEIPTPWEKDRCKYHFHTTTEPCARTLRPSAVAQAASLPHGQKHFPASSKARYDCVECDQTFPSSRDLNSHRQSAEHKESLRVWASRA